MTTIPTLKALLVVLKLTGCLMQFEFLCSLSSCFVIPFSIVITSLGEEGAGLYASHTFVCFLRVSFSHFLFLSVSGLAAVCGCGTPWTFLLTFLYYISSK